MYKRLMFVVKVSLTLFQYTICSSSHVTLFFSFSIALSVLLVLSILSAFHCKKIFLVRAINVYVLSIKQTRIPEVNEIAWFSVDVFHSLCLFHVLVYVLLCFDREKKLWQQHSFYGLFSVNVRWNRIKMN